MKKYILDGITYTYHPQASQWLGDNGVIINDEDFSRLIELSEEAFITELFSNIGIIFSEVQEELEVYEGQSDPYVENVCRDIKSIGYDRIFDLLIEAI